MDPLPNRRRLAPTASLPATTAEVQAQRHGIDPAVSSALQGGVPMRIRRAINTGRDSTFGRTQSQPVFNLSSSSSGAPGGFLTNDQIYREAQGIVHKDELRRQARELQPYGSGGSMDALDLANGSGGREDGGREMRLRFGEDGEVVMEGEETGGSGSKSKSKSKRGRVEDWGLSQGKKSGVEVDDAQADGGEGSDTATEIDEDEDRPPLDPSTSASVSGSTMDEFPPVFTSPAISHPALFRQDRLPAVSSAAGGRAKGGFAGQGGRQMRGLPGRALGKTMSAPVLMGGGGGMEVDVPETVQEGEDGFDVSEWAGQTDF